MNIQNIIDNGENSRTEFKSSDFHNNSLAKEIVAFSNMSGGDVFIGVEDNGAITGIEDNSLEEKVINICRNNIVPPVIPEIFFQTIQGKKILHISVERGKFKPYKVRQSNKYYIRAGSVSIEPTNEELIRLFQNGAQLHFEASKLPGATLDDIDLLKFRLYCTDWRAMEWDDETDHRRLLYNLQIIDEDDQMTVVGALFFAKNITRHLPQAGIEINFFDGKDKTANIKDYKSLDNDLPALVAAAEQFVRFNSSTRATFNSDETRRMDRHDYEPFVVRELVVNAFTHRDWSIFGQKVRLNMFADRLEIFSPGKIPNTLNLTRALAGLSYYRNPVIAQMLKDYKLAEKAGRGLLKIVTFYKKQQLKPPDFDSTEAYFNVTVYNASASRW